MMKIPKTAMTAAAAATTTKAKVVAALELVDASRALWAAVAGGAGEPGEGRSLAEAKLVALCLALVPPVGVRLCRRLLGRFGCYSINCVILLSHLSLSSLSSQCPGSLAQAKGEALRLGALDAQRLGHVQGRLQAVVVDVAAGAALVVVAAGGGGAIAALPAAPFCCLSRKSISLSLVKRRSLGLTPLPPPPPPRLPRPKLYVLGAARFTAVEKRKRLRSASAAQFSFIVSHHRRFLFLCLFSRCDVLDHRDCFCVPGRYTSQSVGGGGGGGGKGSPVDATHAKWGGLPVLKLKASSTASEWNKVGFFPTKAVPHFISSTPACMSFQARLPHMPDSSFHLARFLPHIPERLFQLLEPPPPAFGRRRLPAKGKTHHRLVGQLPRLLLLLDEHQLTGPGRVALQHWTSVSVSGAGRGGGEDKLEELEEEEEGEDGSLRKKNAAEAVGVVAAAASRTSARARLALLASSHVIGHPSSKLVLLH
ncbi:hypothetical protein TYRP_012773 [Tyrophagus putrescentiae]|nr:hypothetical protein TYRP_012773 [Tyrophagus putrescentiae]